MPEDIKDKTSYTIAFLATILAFTTIKEELLAISIPLGFITINLFTAILGFIGLFSLSVYLYALNYFRYSLSAENSKRFKWLQDLAQFLHFFALIYVLIIALLWVINLLVGFLGPYIKPPSSVISIFISVITFLIYISYNFFAGYCIRDSGSNDSNPLQRAEKL